MIKFSKLILESNETYSDLLLNLKDLGFEIEIDKLKNNTISGKLHRGSDCSISEACKEYEELISRLQDEYGLVEGKFQFGENKRDKIYFEVVVKMSSDNGWIKVLVNGDEMTLKPLSYNVRCVWKKGADTNSRGKDKEKNLNLFEFVTYFLDEFNNDYYISWNSSFFDRGEERIKSAKYGEFTKDNIEITFGKTHTREGETNDVRIDLNSCKIIYDAVLSRKIQLKFHDDTELNYNKFKECVRPEDLVK